MPSKAKQAKNRKSASLRNNISRRRLKDPPSYIHDYMVKDPLPTFIFGQWVKEAKRIWDLEQYRTPDSNGMDEKSLYNTGIVGWQEGGINGGDFHVWCEDMEGNVVGDPHFDRYDIICHMKGADPEKPKYHKWPNQQKWLEEKEADDAGISFMRMIPDDVSPFKEWYRNPVRLNCKNNAIAYHLYSGVECKVVIGSMGWKYRNKKGIWWEYG
jgi:hypothetical protein